MWLGITNENKYVSFYVVSQEGSAAVFSSVQQFSLRALHDCHQKFIIRNTTAGLAVNDLNGLLTATIALWCTSNRNKGQPKQREGSYTWEKGYWQLNNFVFGVKTLYQHGEHYTLSVWWVPQNHCSFDFLQKCCIYTVSSFTMMIGTSSRNYKDHQGVLTVSGRLCN